jgi:hypothetical protein
MAAPLLRSGLQMPPARQSGNAAPSTRIVLDLQYPCAFIAYAEPEALAVQLDRKNNTLGAKKAIRRSGWPSRKLIEHALKARSKTRPL